MLNFLQFINNGMCTILVLMIYSFFSRKKYRQCTLTLRTNAESLTLDFSLWNSWVTAIHQHPTLTELYDHHCYLHGTTRYSMTAQLSCVFTKSAAVEKFSCIVDWYEISCISVTCLIHRNTRPVRLSRLYKTTPLFRKKTSTAILVFKFF